MNLDRLSEKARATGLLTLELPEAPAGCSQQELLGVQELTSWWIQFLKKTSADLTNESALQATLFIHFIVPVTALWLAVPKDSRRHLLWSIRLLSSVYCTAISKHLLFVIQLYYHHSWLKISKDNRYATCFFEDWKKKSEWCNFGRKKSSLDTSLVYLNFVKKKVVIGVASDLAEPGNTAANICTFHCIIIEGSFIFSFLNFSCFRMYSFMSPLKVAASDFGQLFKCILNFRDLN